MRHLVARQLVEITILIGAISMLSSALFASPRAKKPDAKLFAYNRSVAFDLKEESAKEQDGVIIRDVNYAAYAPRHGRIKASDVIQVVCTK